MTQGTRQATCVGCDAEFAWEPVRYAGLTYCCDGCSAGGPCTCSYDLAPVDPDAVDHLGLPFKARPAVAPAVPAPERAEVRRSELPAREVLAAR